jgi:hypothetical protein
MHLLMLWHRTGYFANRLRVQSSVIHVLLIWVRAGQLADRVLSVLAFMFFDLIRLDRPIFLMCVFCALAATNVLEDEESRDCKQGSCADADARCCPGT